MYTGRNDKTLTDDDKGAGAMILFLVHGYITSGMRFSEFNKVNY